MHNTLLNRFPVLFDGAMGTRLQALGLPAGHPPEEWNLSHPDLVFQVHQEYVKAGSQIIEANTFGGNRIRLLRYGLADRIREINQAGVRLAREAAGSEVLVAASVGPTGEFLEPFGDRTPDDLLEIYREQVDLLRADRIELFHLETFSHSQESIIACQAVEEAGGQVIASFTFEPRPDGSFTTLMGESPETIGRIFQNIKCLALGINCGTGMREAIEIVRQMRTVYPGRLCCRPNAGMPQTRGEETFFPETPDDFYHGTRHLIAESVAILGGCCGTDARFIQKMKEAMQPS